jgi:hypothetical protein
MKSREFAADRSGVVGPPTSSSEPLSYGRDRDRDRTGSKALKESTFDDQILMESDEVGYLGRSGMSVGRVGSGR